MRRLLPLTLLVFILDCCSSGKAALKHGNYYEAVVESVHRLRTSPDNKKAKEVLQQGYPLAIEYIDQSIQNGIAADDPMKWRNAVKGYEQINFLNDQIKTSLGAMKLIPKPATRFKELAEAKTKAAEESYQAGISALMKNTRDDAKQAYFSFKEANGFEPGYRECIEMMTQAEYNATLRIIYEEVNASRYNVSLQPVVNSLQRQFLSFKPMNQKDTVPPHQYLRIVFNGYREDPRANITTSTEEVKRSIKTGEKKGPDGKPQDIMENVIAKVTYYHKIKRGFSQSVVTITDAGSNAVLQNQNVDGNSAWQQDWASYTGDKRALSSQQVDLCNARESSPSDQYLYNQAITDLQTNLSGQLKQFYSRY
jgi:hypothetical protein